MVYCIPTEEHGRHVTRFIEEVFKCESLWQSQKQGTTALKYDL